MRSRWLILMITLMIFHSEIHATLASPPPSCPDRHAARVATEPAARAGQSHP
jgi:hypothetical protein